MSTSWCLLHLVRQVAASLSSFHCSWSLGRRFNLHFVSCMSQCRLGYFPKLQTSLRMRPLSRKVVTDTSSFKSMWSHGRHLLFTSARASVVRGEDKLWQSHGTFIAMAVFRAVLATIAFMLCGGSSLASTSSFWTCGLTGKLKSFLLDLKSSYLFESVLAYCSLAKASLTERSGASDEVVRRGETSQPWIPFSAGMLPRRTVCRIVLIVMI